MSWFLAETVVRQEFLKAQDSQALAWGRWQGPLLCQALWKPGSRLEPVARQFLDSLLFVSWRVVVPIIARPEN